MMPEGHPKVEPNITSTSYNSNTYCYNSNTYCNNIKTYYNKIASMFASYFVVSFDFRYSENRKVDYFV